jgi:hypothetical protein
MLNGKGKLVDRSMIPHHVQVEGIGEVLKVTIEDTVFNRNEIEHQVMLNRGNDIEHAEWDGNNFGLNLDQGFGLYEASFFE